MSYTGEPKFFTPDGSGVTFEYIEYLRSLLGLKPGESLIYAIAALRPSPPEGPQE